jgi:hypothetical protein
MREWDADSVKSKQEESQAESLLAIKIWRGKSDNNKEPRTM